MSLFCSTGPLWLNANTTVEVDSEESGDGGME